MPEEMEQYVEILEVLDEREKRGMEARVEEVIIRS